MLMYSIYTYNVLAGVNDIDHVVDSNAGFGNIC